MVVWPKHDGGLHITHNQHHAYYETAEKWADDNDHHPAPYDWASPEERAKAIAEDSIWTLQWYPNTPVGFNSVCASTFEACLAAAMAHE